MNVHLAANPFYVFVAGASVFLLGAGLTFLSHYRRQPKPFDIWEFAVVPLAILAVLLWAYWAIDLDRDHALGVTIFGLVLLLPVAVPLGVPGILLWVLLIVYTLQYGGAALDLIGAASVGLLAGGLTGYLTAALWRWIPPRPR